MKKFCDVVFRIMAVLLLVFSPLSLSAQSGKGEDDEIARKVDKMFRSVDKENRPGAAIAIVRDGEIVYKKGYGMANLEYDIPITPSTVFHVASVSKQFTAFSILLLEKDGLLSLDDDVRKYIPEVPDFGKTITLRHLAHHTSGLRDQWSLLALAGWRLDDVITREHILKLVSKQQELNFDPGEEFLYCNTGYTLLAEVVARISGKSFAEFTDERIFKPLKMNHSQFYDDHEKIVKNRAYSYDREQGEFKKRVLSFANVGATSLFTTVEDLSLWALNFENPVVGDTELIEKLRTRGILNNGDTLGYALGQSVFIYRGLDCIGHSGADAGYRSNITRVPEYKFSVIVCSNYGSFNPAGIANQVMNLYLADAIESKKAEMADGKVQAHKKQQAPPRETREIHEEFDAGQLELSEYKGEFYSDELATSYEFVSEEGILKARHQRNSDITLKPEKRDSFSGDAWFFQTLDFVRDETGSITGCRVSSDRVRNVYFRKISLSLP